MKATVLPALFVALAWLAPRVGLAQTVRFDDLALVIKNGHETIRLEKALEMVPIRHVVYTATKRGPDFYLVLGLKEWTRGGPQPRGTCGGGKEEYIRWLHVRDGRIVDRQTGLYNSCGVERTGAVLGWKDGLLLWHAHSDHRTSPDGHMELIPVDYAWTFDAAHPEAGITEHMTDSAMPTPASANPLPSQP